MPSGNRRDSDSPRAEGELDLGRFLLRLGLLALGFIIGLSMCTSMFRSNP